MRFESPPEHDVWGNGADIDDCQGDNGSVTTDDLPTGLLTPTSTIASRAGGRSFTTGATVDYSGLVSLCLTSQRSVSEFEDHASTASSYSSGARSRRPLSGGHRRPNASTTSKSSSGAKNRRSAHQTSTITSPRILKRKLCLWSLIPVGIFLLIAMAGYIVLRWTERTQDTNSNAAIDSFLSSQDEWINVNDLVTQFDYLPTVVKQSESNMIDLMVAIKHSQLRGRERLVSQMDLFATVASSISSHANKWYALAGSNIDRVQNMNYHALRALEAVQRSSSWPVIPAPSPEDSGVIGQLQSAAHAITSAMAHSQMQRVARLHEAFKQEAGRVGDGLGEFRVTGIQLHGEFSQAVRILQNIADIARHEAFLAEVDKDELQKSFWQWFGVYSDSITNLGAHIEYLEGVAGHMMAGHNGMSLIMTEVERLDESFKVLQIALKETKVEKSAYMAQQLDRIQSSIRRLDEVRPSSRARAQARHYESVRRKIEDF